MGDGTDWIKTEADLYFSQAVKIFDWPHLRRVIRKAIRALRPGQGERQRSWRKVCKWVSAASTHLQTLRHEAECEPIEALEDDITYLENQHD